MKKFLIIICFLVAGNDIQAKDCAFKSSDHCYTCDELLSFEVSSPYFCEKYCPNRSHNFENKGWHPTTANCALTNCPKNAPLRDFNGSCYPCDAIQEYVWDIPIQNCDVCPNRYIDEHGNCLLKGQETPKPLWEKDKNAPQGNKDIICPDDKPLKSWNNLCFSCDTKEEIIVDTKCNFDKKEECNAVCENREILSSIGGNPTNILKCPKNVPLMDTVGMCWSCDTPEIINVRYNEQKCESSCKGKRFIFGHECIKCPSNIEEFDYEACLQCNGK